MLLNDEEVTERMESPLNLLNRLRTSLDKTASIIPQNISSNHAPVEIPALPPTIDSLVDDLDAKIRDASTKQKAQSILHAAMDELKNRMPEIQKPERLAAIAAEMARVIERHDNKPRPEDTAAKIIVYAPQIQSIDNYQVVEVNE